MTESITAFAKRYGLSRATLLYYDRIGLLSPSGRSAAGHRFYGPDATARMNRIDVLRRAGLPLAAIRSLLRDGAASDDLTRAVERQLEELNREQAALSAKRRLLLGILARDAGFVDRTAMTVDLWVALLAEAGLDANARQRWHRAFERDAPDDHQAFLASLGLPDGEIEAIRARSR